jgi:hypothetical protein
LDRTCDDLPEGFTDRRGKQFGWAYCLGEIGIVAPDLRSERTRERVMDKAGWCALTASLERMADCRHVLLLSSVPLVHVHLHGLERLFGHIPGHQEWQDDLIDQWPSLAHWDEWTCLLRTLLGFSAERRVQVTSLSGEIHLGSGAGSGAARRRFTSSPLQASFTRRHRPWPSPCSSGLAPSRCSLPSISQRDCYRCPGWAGAS